MARGSSSTNVVESFAFSLGIICLTRRSESHRKAKDYTYLYGSSLDDAESSLTRHLTSAFADGCDELSVQISRLNLGLF